MGGMHLPELTSDNELFRQHLLTRCVRACFFFFVVAVHMLS